MCNRQAFHHHAKARHHWKKQMWAKKKEQWAKSRGFGRFYPPVNVQELDDQYVLFLYAPELTKSDFKIALVDRLLTISADAKPAEDAKWRRQEFEAGGFKRQFELNDKIDTESIAAEYQDGVLKVTLKKLEGFQTSRSEITVA